MDYIDGYVIAVPRENREAYREMAARMAAIFKTHGALGVTEAWGDDVPEGKVTSFPMAVKAQEDEVVVFAWIRWPDKGTRDAGWKAVMDSPEMESSASAGIFDGKRLIYGGFEVLLDA